jgi:hypothetical protein
MPGRRRRFPLSTVYYCNCPCNLNADLRPVSSRRSRIVETGDGESRLSGGFFPFIADEVRERSGGIPIGFKLSAQHIEDDIDFALAASADYIIVDGRVRTSRPHDLEK